jgi:hypothetical protein
MTGSCEHGNEAPGSVNVGNFLKHLTDHELAKKDSAPRS